MDFIDRFHLYIRYSLLAILSLVGKTDTMYFHNQLRKVEHILNINDEFDEEIQSEESSACGMVEDPFQCIDHNEDDEPVGDGEGTEEVESPGPSGEEPNGGEDNEE